MPSFLASFAVVAAALFSLGAQAQSSYYIDPDSVPLATRDSWCTFQKQACPLLCTQLPGESTTTQENDCTAEDLTYSCICANGASPNASEYSQTLPYFICQEYGNQCVKACNGVTACQSACRDDHPCGAQNPTRYNATTTSAVATSTGGADQQFNGLGSTATAASGKKNGSQAALDIGRSYGLAIVLASVFAGFTLVM